MLVIRLFRTFPSYLSREWKAKRPDRPTRDFTNQKGTFPKVNTLFTL